MRICFEVEEFKIWLEKLGCCDCQYYPKLEGPNIVHNWRADINGKRYLHKDFELKGEVSNFQEKWNKITGMENEK